MEGLLSNRRTQRNHHGADRQAYCPVVRSARNSRGCRLWWWPDSEVTISHGLLGLRAVEEAGCRRVPVNTVDDFLERNDASFHRSSAALCKN